MVSGRFTGVVRAGKGDASHWLSLFNAAYVRKLGMPIFPGSLNLTLAEDFDWFCEEVESRTVAFPKEEYGGERDTLLVPCILLNLGGERAYLWTTAAAARDRTTPHVVEVIASKHLRQHFGLRDGSPVEVKIASSNEGAHPDAAAPT